MGRLMPVECQHGVTIDYGDFGPCQDCAEHDFGRCPNIVECEECEAHQRQWRNDLRLVLRAWRCSTGLRRRAGIDPKDVNGAAERLERKWLDD